jgi:hypothetical protein
MKFLADSKIYFIGRNRWRLGNDYYIEGRISKERRSVLFVQFENDIAERPDAKKLWNQ